MCLLGSLLNAWPPVIDSKLISVASFGEKHPAMSVLFFFDQTS
jgi:hypothetical protein